MKKLLISQRDHFHSIFIMLLNSLIHQNHYELIQFKKPYYISKQIQLHAYFIYFSFQFEKILTVAHSPYFQQPRRSTVKKYNCLL